MEISKIPTTVRNVQGWYEKSMVRNIHGTKSPQMVRNVYGTNSLWYEKSGNHFKHPLKKVNNLLPVCLPAIIDKVTKSSLAHRLDDRVGHSHPMVRPMETRSQAIARIADRTAPHHFRGSRHSRGLIGTQSLNPVVFEILRSKHIGVTSLNFQGHVTSLVT